MRQAANLAFTGKRTDVFCYVVANLGVFTYQEILNSKSWPNLKSLIQSQQNLDLAIPFGPIRIMNALAATSPDIFKPGADSHALAAGFLVCDPDNHKVEGIIEPGQLISIDAATGAITCTFVARKYTGPRLAVNSVDQMSEASQALVNDPANWGTPKQVQFVFGGVATRLPASAIFKTIEELAVETMHRIDRGSFIPHEG